jgi:hypothetical protein
MDTRQLDQAVEQGIVMELILPQAATNLMGRGNRRRGSSVFTHIRDYASAGRRDGERRQISGISLRHFP